MDPLDAPATKRDLLNFVTKQDLAELEDRLDAKFEALETRLTRWLAAEIARGANLVIEHMTSLFRVADDRITIVEARLEAHATDATVHRTPRRRAR